MPGVTGAVDTLQYWYDYQRRLRQLRTGSAEREDLSGKIFTQRIERNSLTLRTRIKRLTRKTICLSRSIEIHEKVIDAFIKKYMFY